MFEKLITFLQFPFVRYALIVGVLIALCSSLFGVTLVLKRYSHIGDGLSHVAFGAMAVAGIAGLTNENVIVLPVTILCAVMLLRNGQNSLVAMLSVGALAVGYLLLNLFSMSSNLSGDVCATLFGSTSILTLSGFEMWLCVGLSCFVIIAYFLLYNRIFAITFDENFAKATGES